METTAYPTLRYPQYLTEYLAKHHDYTYPATAPEAHIPLYDHLFVVALEAQRIRERGLPGLVNGLTQEVGWVARSMHGAPKDRQPFAVYEQIGDVTPDGLTLRGVVHRLNEREHEVNQLCRALEVLAASAK